MNNMELYNRMRQVPEEAKKTIGAGRLKGFTDINPMWRIKALTETFGPCGIGWWYEITDKRLEGNAEGTEIRAFVDINLYYEVDGKVSHAVPGTGGASFITQERSGAYTSDECYKMALTDAISTAAKALGVAADVYYAKDRDKYTTAEDKPAAAPAPAPAPAPKPEEPVVICSNCGKPVVDYGKKTKWEILEYTKQRFGIPYCGKCLSQFLKAEKAKEEGK